MALRTEQTRDGWDKCGLPNNHVVMKVSKLTGLATNTGHDKSALCRESDNRLTGEVSNASGYNCFVGAKGSSGE